MTVPKDDFRLTDAQVLELQRVGEVPLSDSVRRRLDTLASFWLSDLWARQSARPKEFRKRLDEIGRALTDALRAVSLSDIGPNPSARVSPVDRHLLHWAIEAPVSGASRFDFDLLALISQISSVLAVVTALKECLPADSGRSRRYGDEGRIKSLADIFEEAGGVATAYASEDASTGFADTPFRRFAQRFYSFLPADHKRATGGLDNELRKVLPGRRSRS
jgi:hypothetical protein